jgi:hypothetical protein
LLAEEALVFEGLLQQLPSVELEVGAADALTIY